MALDKNGILAAAKALLSDESAWCKHANARDADDLPVPARSPRAIRWDIYGALLKVSDIRPSRAFNEAYQHLKGKIPLADKNKDIERYNDDINHSTLLSMFD